MTKCGLGLVFALALSSAACTLLLDTDDLSPSATPSPGASDAGPVVDGDRTLDAGTSDADGGAAADRYRDEVLLDEPKAYFRLADAVGATKAKDEVAGRDGNYASLVLGEPGPASGHPAARFDGASSYVQIPYGFSIAGAQPFTVEAWIAPDPDTTLGCHHVFTCQQRESPKRGFALLTVSSGSPEAPDGVVFERFSADEGRSSRQGEPLLPPENVFTHVVGVYDGDNSRLFVNGRLEQVGSPDGRGVGAFDVGSYIGTGSPGDCPWKGRIAEVSIYEKALTPERISAHFAAMPK